MVNSTPRISGGVLFLLMVCAGLVVAPGCKTETSSAGQPVLRLAGMREPDWKPLTSARAVLTDNGSADVLPETIGANSGLDSDSDLRMVDAARSDLRHRVQDLAEVQIARETNDLRENANAQVDARIRELKASNDREYQDAADKIAFESSNRVRDAEMEFQQPSLDLRVKLAALNARQGLFGGAIDAQAQTESKSLQAELTQLEKRRQDKIQAVRDSEAAQLSELRKKQQSGVDAETARLRSDGEAQVAVDARERRDRLSADLYQGQSDNLPKMETRIAASRTATDRSGIFSRKATESVESRFNRDIAAARDSARKRQKDMKRRELQDRALMSKR